jgi:CSLREA domain-containing protein
VLGARALSATAKDARALARGSSFASPRGNAIPHLGGVAPGRKPIDTGGMRKIGSLFLATALLALLPTAAGAETFTVNKRGDHVPGACTADDCTLREAVVAAGQPALEHKIKLPSTKPYRLKRSALLPGPDDAKGDLDLITGNWHVDLVHPGPGRAKIDASAADDRVLELDGNANIRKVVLRGGTASGGEFGGGIRAGGAIRVLTMDKSKVIGNQALQGGGIFTENNLLFVEESVIKGNMAGGGAGVYVAEAGRFQIERSTVTGNIADHDGGALWIGTDAAEGASRIEDSTIAGNETLSGGGAIANEAALLRIENSTLSKNRAWGRGGGIYAAPDTLAKLNGVTIARNRSDTDNSGGADSAGGIYADGGSDVVEIQNSLVVKNRSTDGAIQECDAPAPVGIDSLGGNLITSGDDCPFFDHPEDLLDPAPLIAKLMDAGGPTKTIALKAGSPAINEADGPDPLERDQRGQLRANPDTGAFER